MGNILRRRKKVVTEELETLSQRMKIFRDDIEKTAEVRRMILWYLTLSTFFLSTSFIGYAWITIKRKDHQVIFSMLAFTGGLILLWFGRRITNAFCNWRISRKRQSLDGLVARKKSLLEIVKETETFKVAKEILEKYDQESPKSVFQPHSPFPEERTPASRREQPSSAQVQTDGIPTEGSTNRSPIKMLYTKDFANIPTTEAGPARCLSTGPKLKPIRPFQRESTTTIDKLVDYFFGDGPSQRLALICFNCHGHNGMALPAEYDYLAFVCFLCGYFNPAKKFRPTHQLLANASTPPRDLKSQVTELLTTSSRSSLDQNIDGGRTDDKEQKNDASVGSDRE